MRHGKQSRRIRGSSSAITISLSSAVTGPTGHALTSIDLEHGPTNSGATTDGITNAGLTVPAMVEAAHFTIPSVVSASVPTDTFRQEVFPPNHELAGRNNNLIRDLQFQIGYTQILDAATSGQAGWTQGIANASGLGAPSQGSNFNLRDSNLALIGNWHEVEGSLLRSFGDFGFAGETSATAGITKGQGFAADDERSKSFTPIITERFLNTDPSIDDELLSREAILRRIGFGEHGHAFSHYIGNFRTSAAVFADTVETNIKVDDPPPPIVPEPNKTPFRSGANPDYTRPGDGPQVDAPDRGGFDTNEIDDETRPGGGVVEAGGFDDNTPQTNVTLTVGPTIIITPPTFTTNTPDETNDTTDATDTTTNTTRTDTATDDPGGGTGDDPTLVMRQGRGIFCYNLCPGNLFEHFPGPGDRVYGAGLRLVPRGVAGRLSDITDTEPSLDGDMHFRIVGFTTGNGAGHNFTPEATQHMTWDFLDITSDTTNGGIAWAATGAFGVNDSNLGISTGFTISSPVDLNNPITINMTEFVQDALDNQDGILRFMLLKEPDNDANALGAVQFYGWCGRENTTGRQDFEPDLFVRYMPAGSTGGSGADVEPDMGIASIGGATHPNEKFVRRDARNRHEFYPPIRQRHESQH